MDFAGGLTRFAAAHADPHVTEVAARTAAPLRVVVRGRRGVGCTSVARALGGAQEEGGADVGDVVGDVADVVVYVTAEVLKPEDTTAIADARRVVVVLNKADLIGSLSGGREMRDGPLEASRRRCAELAASIGVPLVPMIAPLAVAARDGLDGASWAALRTLATHPGGAGSYADFLTAPVPVPAGQRVRLLDTLDLFGVAVATAALRRGWTPTQVRTVLRRLSGVDAVMRGVAELGAEVRYRRVLDAVADLEALAVPRTRLAASVGAYLCRDDTVLARMAAAAEFSQAAGLEPGDPVGHLERAARWQRRLAGANELHRACGSDIVRGSLLLWSRARR